MEKHLGKIKSLRVGMGGYQDAQFGLSVDLQFAGSTHISDFCGGWSQSITPTDTCQWTEADRDIGYAKVLRYMDKLCTDAKVSDVMHLVGKPVEVTLNGMILDSWRLLTEVL